MVFTFDEHVEILIGAVVSMSIAGFKNWYLSKDFQKIEIAVAGFGWVANHSLRKYYLRRYHTNNRFIK